MYFQVSKRNFYNALSIVSRAISNFSPLPTFSGIKIDVNEYNLVLTGSDSDISIQTTLANNDDCFLKIQDRGTIVIEAKYILEIVRKIDSELIEVELFDNYSIKISGNSATFNINGMNASDYPVIDFSQPKVLFELPQLTLRKLITQTSFATSDKEARPILNGVNFQCVDNELHCVGTDSYRLAKKSVSLNNAMDFNVTIPSKSLQEVVKTLDDSENVQIAIDDKKAQFIINNTIIQTRLIDGAYPETNRLIPLNFEYELTIDSKDLLNAIDRASFIKSEGVSIIHFSLSNNECILSSRSAEVGSSKETLSSASFEGKSLEISCNGRYVFEAIRALGGDLVKFKFCGDMKPFIITSLNDDKILQLVLPVRTYA